MDLVVGAGESVIQWLLLPRLPGLAQAHPRLTVTFQNLKMEDILRQVLDGGIDFGVVTREVAGSNPVSNVLVRSLSTNKAEGKRRGNVGSFDLPSAI